MAHAAPAGPRRFLSWASVVCIAEDFADLTHAEGRKTDCHEHPRHHARPAADVPERPAGPAPDHRRAGTGTGPGRGPDPGHRRRRQLRRHLAGPRHLTGGTGAGLVLESAGGATLGASLTAAKRVARVAPRVRSEGYAKKCRCPGFGLPAT